MGLFLPEQEAMPRASGMYKVSPMPQRRKERQNQEKSKGYVIQQGETSVNANAVPGPADKVWDRKRCALNKHVVGN